MKTAIEKLSFELERVLRNTSINRDTRIEMAVEMAKAVRDIRPPSIEETYFLAVDCGEDGEPDVVFAETEPGRSLETVVNTIIAGDCPPVVGVYRRAEKHFDDVTEIAAFLVSCAKDGLSSVARDFLDARGYELEAAE